MCVAVSVFMPNWKSAMFNFNHMYKQIKLGFLRGFGK